MQRVCFRTTTTAAANGLPRDMRMREPGLG